MSRPETAPEGDSSRSAQAERRAWVRYASDMEARCSTTGALRDAGWPGRVSDISMGGVGLVLRHRFRRGTPLEVELKNAAGTVRIIVLARVRHTTPVAAGNANCWLVGCEFDRPLTEPELNSLVS
jgi:hypothetical protein